LPPLCRRGYSAETKTGRLLLQKLDYLQLLLIKRAGAALSAVARGMSEQLLRGVQQGLAVAGLKNHQQQQQQQEHVVHNELQQEVQPSEAEEYDSDLESPVSLPVSPAAPRGGGGESFGAAAQSNQQEDQHLGEHRNGEQLRHLDKGSDCKAAKASDHTVSPGHQVTSDIVLQQHEQVPKHQQQQQGKAAGESGESSGTVPTGAKSRTMSPAAADAAVLLAALAATASLSDEALDAIDVELLLDTRRGGSSSSSSETSSISSSGSSRSSSRDKGEVPVDSSTFGRKYLISGEQCIDESGVNVINSLESAVPVAVAGTSVEVTTKQPMTATQSGGGDRGATKGPVVGFVGSSSSSNDTTSSSSRIAESSSSESGREMEINQVALSGSVGEHESGSETDNESGIENEVNAGVVVPGGALGGGRRDIQASSGSSSNSSNSSNSSSSRSSPTKRKRILDLRWMGRAIMGKSSSSSDAGGRKDLELGGKAVRSRITSRDRNARTPGEKRTTHAGGNGGSGSDGSDSGIGGRFSKTRGGKRTTRGVRDAGSGVGSDGGSEGGGGGSTRKVRKKRRGPLELGAVRAARERLQRETSSAAAETSAVASAAAGRAVSVAVLQLGRRFRRTTEQLLFLLSDWGLVPRLGVTPLEVFDRVYPIKEPGRLKPLYIQKASLPDILGKELRARSDRMVKERCGDVCARCEIKGKLLMLFVTVQTAGGLPTSKQH
jgi:hypothetical protein